MADKTDDRTQPGQLIDEVELVDAGGPRDHIVEAGVGQRAPGPVDQTVGSVGPFDVVGGPEDRGGVADPGGPDQHSPAIQGGVRLPGSPLAPTARRLVDDRSRGSFGAIEDHHAWELSEDLVKRIPRVGGSGSVEDEIGYTPGGPAEFNAFTPTLDGEGTQHLYDPSGIGVFRLFPWDFRNAPWHDPTSYADFTGYGRDAYRYTNGVQDAGPVTSPWGLEAQGINRSSRRDCPILGLVAVNNREVILYDLDNFPTTLDVWARFEIPHSASYYFAGRNSGSVRWAKFLDGVLYLATQYTTGASTVNGALFAIDFRRDGQTCMRYIRADAQGRAAVGKTIVDRNSTSWWESEGAERLSNEYVYDVDVFADPYDYRTHVAVLAGEDDFELVRLRDNDLFENSYVNPATTLANAGRTRFARFDSNGFLWLAQNMGDGTSRIFCNGLDWRGGVCPNPFVENHGDVTRRYRKRVLPFEVEWMEATPRRIALASSEGVYLLNREDLTYNLAFTDASPADPSADVGSGRRDVTPGAGALLLGDKQGNRPMGVWHIDKTSYLFVSNIWGRGGVAVLRFHDDQVVYSAEDPVLQEDGAYVAAGIVV